MDVDREKIAMATLPKYEEEITSEKMIRNDANAIKKYFGKLADSTTEVVACYEAGFCGFELAHRLTDLGVLCYVAAPGMLPRRPSDRVKTDRRDARALAKALRNNDVSPVFIPTKQDEGVRDYLRMVEDVKGELKRAKQRVIHFLYRRGLRYTDGNNWTEKHRRWLKALQLEIALDQETLEEYYAHVVGLEDKRRRMNARIEEIAKEDRYVKLVRRLTAFKGIGTLIALSLIVEVCDFRRFITAAQFMAFLGLVPSEHSSGNKRRLGGITKAGNSHLRKLLIEAAWQYRSYHPDSRRLAKRREGLPAPLIAYADRAGRRLHKKYVRMVFAGKKSQVAATAVARELAGFIWGAMTGNVA
jgi:transposase